MGRNVAARSTAIPVENYRKEIGKHDIKKDKKGLSKELKDRKDAKASAMTIQEVGLVVITGLAVVAGIYFIFYLYIV